MRSILFAIVVLALVSCNDSTEKHSKHKKDEAVKITPAAKPDFNKYAGSLGMVPLPFKHSTVTEALPAFSKNYDKAGFGKYKQRWTQQPIGILYKTDNNIVTMESSKGDEGSMPYIISYDKNGNKLDSLLPYKKTGFDMGYESVEYLTINKNKTITVTDSTKRWKLNKDKTDIIKNSMTLSVGTTVYEITVDGKIKKKV